VSEAERALTALLELMARLRDPERGCPWDREQTFASIAPYTIEEAYEVADAIERGDREHLREELGDLLFQVVFHARMAQERGWFDFAAVAHGIREKLVRRHPHLFAGAALAPHELVHAWERQKAEERAAAAAAGESSSVLAGIPRSLPALTRAEKLSRRAARVGFDWPDAQAVRAKVLEEVAEIDSAGTSADRAPSPEWASSAGRSAALTEELGDLLFAIVNWSRHLEVDAEAALRAANGKFERRFEAMERLATERGRRLEELSAAEWDHLWREVKLNRT
jgi:nucleoside triphosphate diphosphatase